MRFVALSYNSSVLRYVIGKFYFQHRRQLCFDVSPQPGPEAIQQINRCLFGGVGNQHYCCQQFVMIDPPSLYQPALVHRKPERFDNVLDHKSRIKKGMTVLRAGRRQLVQSAAIIVDNVRPRSCANPDGYCAIRRIETMRRDEDVAVLFRQARPIGKCALDAIVEVHSSVSRAGSSITSSGPISIPTSRQNQRSVCSNDLFLSGRNLATFRRPGNDVPVANRRLSAHAW